MYISRITMKNIQLTVLIIIIFTISNNVLARGGNNFVTVGGGSCDYQDIQNALSDVSPSIQFIRVVFEVFNRTM